MERIESSTRAGLAARAAIAAAHIGVAVAAAAAVYLIARLALYAFTIPDTTNTLWWPTAAVVIAVLIRVPARWWLAILVGDAAAMAWIIAGLGSLPDVVSYTITGLVEIVLVAVLLTGPGGGRRLRTRTEAVRFAVAVAVAMAASALLLTVRTFAIPTGAPWQDTVGEYVLTHFLGLLIFAPLLLPGPLNWRVSARYYTEFAAMIGLAVAIGVWSFLPVDAPGRAFPLLLPVVWAGVRSHVLRATATTVVVATIAACGTVRGLGPFDEIANVDERALMTQVFLGTAASISLILVLVTRYRVRLAAQARAGELTMRRAIRDSLVPMYSIHLGDEHFGEIRDANTALASVLGYRSEDLEGRHCALLGAGDDAERRALLDSYLVQLRDGAISSYREESQFVKADGEPLWVETNVSRVNPVTGPPFALVHVHDLTQRQQNKEQLEQMALHDPLTGLANRTVLFARLREAFDELPPAGRSVGLLYIDLDGFKEINDTYGHASGDAVLVEVARRLLGAVRPGDTVVRLGGDEFAVVCASVPSAADLDRIAERVRAGLTPAIGLPGGTMIPVHASIGLAVAGAGGDPDHLLLAADTKMYQAKRAARRAGRERR